MNKVEIGFPLEYEDNQHIIRNGIFLRENEVEALKKKLKQLEAYENMRKELIEYSQDLRLYDNESIEFKISDDLLNILNKVGSDK